MDRALFLTGGRILDPGQKIDRLGSVLVSEGKVAWLGVPGELPPGADFETIDTHGMVLSPGFIDLHCHLRQPGYEEKETIATGTRAASRGGFTTVCCMPNTNPPLDTPETIVYVKSTAAKEGVVRVLPIGCISKGRNGEAPADVAALAGAGAVAFSDDGSPVMDIDLMRQILEESRALSKPVIDHCEDINLAGKGVMNNGEASARLGLPGIPAAAEEVLVARDIMLARVTGGHIHIAHVSTAGSVELIRRAKQEGLRVTAEATPHHLTLTEDIVSRENANTKVNPPLRSRRDVESLVEALAKGVIDAVATDHAPHTAAEKARGFIEAPFGISGLETALGSLMSLVHGGRITLSALISRLTTGPARILGAAGLMGTLCVGAPADIVIFNPDKEWAVNPDSFASKGRNTPLAGAVLRGKVLATIFGGRIVFQDESTSILTRATQAGEHVIIPGSFKKGRAPLLESSPFPCEGKENKGDRIKNNAR